MRVDWSLQTLSVDAVTESWANRSIRPNPEYQRGLQWKRRQQQLLIDSIFRGYPLPRFYFERKASKDPLGTAVVSLDVIDGQQRIIALTQFRNDEWPLFHAGTPLTTQQVRDAWPGNVSPYVEVLAGKLNRQGRFQRLFSAIDRRGGGARDETGAPGPRPRRGPQCRRRR
ncbi:MAG: DUF262 domain-containing protein [Acidimicrobiales bacterium]